ncbi:MAG: fumarate hydratase, partial [Candidatus Adiutrix sp.]|nr:fumarate hydratase [Candidatus Adiutrix sp.]
MPEGGTIREISCDKITEAVSEMCVSSNCLIGEDIRKALTEAEKIESNPLGREVLSTLLANAAVAREKMMPLCQDTGLAV